MNIPITSKTNTTAGVNSDANPTAGDCSHCRSKETWLLHHVRLRGIYRRLCTCCVLRLHPASFCPLCFTFYDTTPPPPSKRLSCSNCSSFTHSHCAPSQSPSFAFLCPPCADPNFSFFHLDKTNNRTIDKKMATVLLCAAKIAACSMAKAVVVARAEAERRVREAAVCRKRAREALENVALVAKRKEVESVEVSGSGNLGKRERDGIDGTVIIGSPKNVERIASTEIGKNNGIANNNSSVHLQKGLDNGNNTEKKPSSQSNVSVKPEGVNSLPRNP
ncbi:hypothetical protein JCGZ_23170 [Jatropha curcas]|uniref:Uncharacterized protein n=1 Tax=Jatropha curcas TaxID=180498 RepID=A0A067JHK0_JATCU|nr:uncharacterized protein LOC105647377 [Jatropha curcas]KDP23337.1 hypothetical protein JCGZ_23170 [Jatropha curcas]